jgi:proline iminopeptidase
MSGMASTRDSAAGTARTARGSWLAERMAHRRIGIGVAAGLALLAGLVLGWLMPRGPVTAAHALGAMALLSLVGLAAGLLSRSRWSLIVVPVVLVLAFEVARAGTPGPTVDRVHLGSTYGIIAFVVGRGVTWLLFLPPVLLGTSLGLGLAGLAGRAGARRTGWLGWGLTALLAVVVAGLAAGIARPATTAPIVGLEGPVPAGSIAELTRVPVGGHEQALMIRGRSVENPVLLHLAGGPGGTDIGAMRADTGLESDFVVVTWDQRGTGKSYDALDPVATLTLEGMVADTIELTEHLRERFGEERIYLHGQSWGSTLGVLAVQRRPDLYHAFVGSGQMVSQRETDIMFWEDTLAWAERSGEEELASTLRRNGPPPYDDILDYEIALSHEHDWNPYPELDTDKELPFTLFVPENDLLDQVNGLRAFLDTFSVLYPQLQGIDFRRDVPMLEVPVYVITGAHEARGRAVLAREWFEALEAPAKEWIVFEHSGHRPSFEEPDTFVRVMARVRAETSAAPVAQATGDATP